MRKEIHIGFTGSQKGMTDLQMNHLHWVLRAYKTLARKVFLHHGDCVGSDALAVNVAFQEGILLVSHPPEKEDKRYFAHRRVAHEEVKPEKDYLVRNRDIVDCCDVLLATPSGKERLRSGTWATVRYAIKVKKPLLVLDV